MAPRRETTRSRTDAPTVLTHPRTLASAFVALGVASLYGAHRWQARPIPFDRALWLAETRLDDDRNVRLRMLDDVARRQVRVGMPLREVVAKLGPCPPSRYGADAYLSYPVLERWSYRWNGAHDRLFVYFHHDRVVRLARESHEW